jgi:hypothetical protein
LAHRVQWLTSRPIIEIGERQERLEELVIVRIIKLEGFIYRGER